MKKNCLLKLLKIVYNKEEDHSAKFSNVPQVPLRDFSGFL